MMCYTNAHLLKLTAALFRITESASVSHPPVEEPSLNLAISAGYFVTFTRIRIARKRVPVWTPLEQNARIHPNPSVSTMVSLSLKASFEMTRKEVTLLTERLLVHWNVKGAS